MPAWPIQVVTCALQAVGSCDTARRDNFAGTALLEMYDGNDRLVLDHGASGAPVVDCEGRVVAVVGMAITQTINFIGPAVRASTAWQTPNVVSIPIQVLKRLPRLD